MSATDVDVRGPHFGEPAYKRYDEEMRRLIGTAIMPKGHSPSELYYVLEVAATYKLDPFTREIWAVRMNTNGDTGPVTILVGEQGLLAIAERHPDFRGVRFAAVYANDKCDRLANPVQMPDGTYSHWQHSYSVTADRGHLVGAFAEVYREGRPTIDFWAPLGEYKRSGERSPWSKQQSVMICKCALSAALRRAFRISGLYDEAELPALAAGRGVNTAAADTTPEQSTWRERLTVLYDEFARLSPTSTMPGQRKLDIDAAVAAGDDACAALETALIERIEQAGGVAPEAPIEVEAEEVTDETVTVDPEAENIEFGPADDTPETLL